MELSSGYPISIMIQLLNMAKLSNYIFHGKVESFSVSIYQDATYQLVANSDNRHQEPADTVESPLQPSQVNFAKFVVKQ